MSTIILKLSNYMSRIKMVVHAQEAVHMVTALTVLYVSDKLFTKSDTEQYKLLENPLNNMQAEVP